MPIICSEAWDIFFLIYIKWNLFMLQQIVTILWRDQCRLAVSCHANLSKMENCAVGCLVLVWSLLWLYYAAICLCWRKQVGEVGLLRKQVCEGLYGCVPSSQTSHWETFISLTKELHPASGSKFCFAWEEKKSHWSQSLSQKSRWVFGIFFSVSVKKCCSIP